MYHLRSALMAGLSAASLVASLPSALADTASAGAPDGTPHLLTELQFNSATPQLSTSVPSADISVPGWALGAQDGASIGVDAAQGPDGATVNALVGSYPVPTGGNYLWATYTLPERNLQDVYIEFWAKMPSQYKGGCKFLKVFGQRTDGGTVYADTTIGTDYTGAEYGAIRQIGFGDGTSTINDSQNVINLSGADPQWIGQSYGTAVVQTPQMSVFHAADWGTAWHHFRVHVRFNDGTTSQNEVADGEYYLEIDGKVYVDATGLYNRNPADLPIDSIEFFGWSQTQTQPFDLEYYDIRISTGGFMPESNSAVLPEPPSHPAATVAAG
jgi:hypothetical protein